MSGSLEDLKDLALKRGFPATRLEDVFLALVDEDNQKQGGM